MTIMILLWLRILLRGKILIIVFARSCKPWLPCLPGPNGVALRVDKFYIIIYKDLDKQKTQFLIIENIYLIHKTCDREHNSYTTDVRRVGIPLNTHPSHYLYLGYLGSNL